MKQNHHYDALKHLLTQALRHSDGVVVVEMSTEAHPGHAGMGHMGCGCQVCKDASVEATEGPAAMRALSVKRQVESKHNQPQKRIVVEAV